MARMTEDRDKEEMEWKVKERADAVAEGKYGKMEKFFLSVEWFWSITSFIIYIVENPFNMSHPFMLNNFT